MDIINRFVASVIVAARVAEEFWYFWIVFKYDFITSRHISQTVCSSIPERKNNQNGKMWEGKNCCLRNDFGENGFLLYH